MKLIRVFLSPAESANLAPWFPPHLQRNIYLTLLHLEPEASGGDGQEKKAPKVPDSVLRAALLRRAVEDIHRIIQIRSAKQACGALLQRGSVGDDLWQRFLRAEKEMEEELRDVVMEVSGFSRGFGVIRTPTTVTLRITCRRETGHQMLTSRTGQCPCTQLGPDNLPVGQRDSVERGPAQEARRDPVPGRGREGVVGEAASIDPEGLPQGARRR